MPKSTEELMLGKLDLLLRVATIGITNGLKQRDQIALLNRVGFQPKDIADLLGTTGNTVSKELSTMRKAKRTRASGGERTER